MEKEKTFRQIYVPVDNSPLSNEAVEMSLAIASRCGSGLVGSHVYATKLHERRFRMMESGLPPDYRGEEALENQRSVRRLQV